MITKLIGYDAGPADLRRVAKAIGKWPPGHAYRYPLVEWGWARERCIQAIEAAGLPVPPKSACFMCPASKRHEITWLAARHPHLLSLALTMEKKALERGLESVRGLGRSFAWSGLLSQRNLFEA